MLSNIGWEQSCAYRCFPLALGRRFSEFTETALLSIELYKIDILRYFPGNNKMRLKKQLRVREENPFKKYLVIGILAVLIIFVLLARVFRPVR